MLKYSFQYQRLKQWYLMPPCLTLNIIMYGSRVKWVISRKGVKPFPKPWCCSYQKGSLRVTLDYGRQLYLLILKWQMCLYKTFTTRYNTDAVIDYFRIDTYELANNLLLDVQISQKKCFKYQLCGKQFCFNPWKHRYIYIYIYIFGN